MIRPEGRELEDVISQRGRPARRSPRSPAASSYEDRLGDADRAQAPRGPRRQPAHGRAVVEPPAAAAGDRPAGHRVGPAPPRRPRLTEPPRLPRPRLTGRAPDRHDYAPPWLAPRRSFTRWKRRTELPSSGCWRRYAQIARARRTSLAADLLRLEMKNVIESIEVAAMWLAESELAGREAGAGRPLRRRRPPLRPAGANAWRRWASTGRLRRPLRRLLQAVRLLPLAADDRGAGRRRRGHPGGLRHRPPET